jgi:hypothetical protein
MGGFPRPTGVKVDARIEAFTNYRDNLHKNFNIMKPSNMLKTIIFAGIIPAFIYLKIKQSQVPT